MLKADLLSRRKDHQRGVKDNEGLVLSKVDLIRALSEEKVMDSGTQGDTFMEKIKYRK